MLTLDDVRRVLGVSADHRTVLRRLRRLEQTSGRRLVASYGAGRRTRYLVDPGAFSEALEGPQTASHNETSALGSIDEVAALIADTVRQMDERHTQMSVDLRETKKRLALAEESILSLKARIVATGVNK